MKLLIIVLFLAFSVLTAVLPRVKRAMAEAAKPQEGGDTQSFEGGEAGSGDDFFGFVGDEAEETVAPQPEYFTYESPAVETVVEAQPVIQAEAVEELPRQQFDLRQAVIYQTLLDNRYTSLNN